MNTTPFYELHDRLYDRASAGCASIAEDFQLKRAVENMAPLAEANKTFARLGNMCAKLFTEPEPALLLTECDESRRSKAVCLTRRCNTMLQGEITGRRHGRRRIRNFAR